MKKTLRRLSALLCVLALCLSTANALTVEEAVALLEQNYIEALPAAAYEAETLDELFDIVGDPYTYYMSAEHYQGFQDTVESESSVVGIGVTIEYTADGILIVTVLPGGSAEEAGLKAGDCIIAVGGVSCAPAAEAHRDLILGEEGTFVDLTVRHADGRVRDYRMDRRKVELHNTLFTYKNGIGTMDCNSFGLSTTDYFVDNIVAYPDAKLWVVDLRGNGGGYTDPAIYILGAFTGNGCKLIFNSARRGRVESSIASPAMTDKPVIVLVDGESASSSEILAGGIRAEKAGIVLGSRTYGKGSAQVVFDQKSYPELFDDDALKVTIYRFYCGDGCVTDKVGVLPTLLVDDAMSADIAALLSVDAPAQGEYLTLTLNGIPFYLSLSARRSAAFGELLAALPPDADIVRTADSEYEKLTAAQALARYGSAADSRCFTDVSDSPYATQINTLGTYRILGGVGEGRFDPESTLTRAQLAAMLAQALQLNDGPSGLFSDVPEGRWYTGKIGAVAKLGFMDGTGDGRFDPDAPLTQEQFIAVMGRLARFLNINVDDYALKNADAAAASDSLSAFSPWARLGANVLTCYDRNMLYTSLNEIVPAAPVTRAQAAATLCNMLKNLHMLSY